MAGPRGLAGGLAGLRPASWACERPRRLANGPRRLANGPRRLANGPRKSWLWLAALQGSACFVGLAAACERTENGFLLLTARGSAGRSNQGMQRISHLSYYTTPAVGKSRTAATGRSGWAEAADRFARAALCLRLLYHTCGGQIAHRGHRPLRLGGSRGPVCPRCTLSAAIIPCVCAFWICGKSNGLSCSAAQKMV